MGVYKPLLPFDGTHLVIEKTVDCFKQAGIADIRVVVGFKRKLLTPVLERLGVQIIINSKFAEGNVYIDTGRRRNACRIY